MRPGRKFPATIPPLHRLELHFCTTDAISSREAVTGSLGENCPAVYRDRLTRPLQICRAEQLRALRYGKCVIPLLVPANFVDRPEALEALRNGLITDGESRHIALTALNGMGGIGKTVLAQALCQDEVVQQAFPDGIIRITVGKEPSFDLVTRMREVGKALNDHLSRYDNELGCTNQYRNTIRSKAALIVIDDVWRARDVEPFLAESPRSRLLFTTRDASIAAAVGAQEHTADLLTQEQSREVLARWSGLQTDKLPSQADGLIRECGQLPLALSLIGAKLKRKPLAYWDRVLDLFGKAGSDSRWPRFAKAPTIRS
jgi:NB-ARC domain